MTGGERTGIEPVEIVAGALQLRPPSPAEAAEALALLTDPEVLRWNPAPAVVDLASARAWCGRGADWSDGTHATFSALEASSGRLLANISLHHVDAEQRTADIGYRVAPWARGRGVASSAVGAVTGWALGALGLARVQLLHAVENAASCRVAANAGYLLEGTLRSATRYGDGHRHDDHLHARLPTDPATPGR